MPSHMKFDTINSSNQDTEGNSIMRDLIDGRPSARNTTFALADIPEDIGNSDAKNSRNQISYQHDETFDELYQLPNKKKPKQVNKDESKRPFSPPIKQHTRDLSDPRSRHESKVTAGLNKKLDELKMQEQDEAPPLDIIKNEASDDYAFKIPTPTTKDEENPFGVTNQILKTQESH